MMAQELKSEAFFVRMAPTELRMLRELAEQSGMAQADVIRQLVRREYAKTFAVTGRRKVKR